MVFTPIHNISLVFIVLKLTPPKKHEVSLYHGMTLYVGARLSSGLTDTVSCLVSALAPNLLVLCDCVRGSSLTDKVVVLLTGTHTDFFGFLTDGVSTARPLSHFSCPCISMHHPEFQTGVSDCVCPGT